MKSVNLFHNPGAGDEEHTQADLIELLKENGYDCRYLSTKEKNWKNFDANADLMIIAGGDGTIRNVAEVLLDRKLLDKPGPLGLIPLGTANNISKTLGITLEMKEIITSLKNARIKRFDVGRIYNVSESGFFLESFGYGVFPYLMKEMEKIGDALPDSPAKKIQKALEVLHQIIISYEPRECQLQVDGTDHSGKYLLAEIMNTRSIGPNLCISPQADPGDGEFEIVLVPEHHKEKFLTYVSGKLKGREEPYLFHTLKGKDITISWNGTHVHIDDELVKLKKEEEVRITVKQGLLEFLIP